MMRQFITLAAATAPIVLVCLLAPPVATASDWSAPRFEAPYLMPYPPAAAVSLRDFDSDGIPDMILQGGLPGLPELHFCRGLGNGLFERAAATPINSEATTLAAGDMTGDGVADVVLVTSSPPVVPPISDLVVYQGQTNGTFVLKATFPISSGHLVMGDIDGDGREEALFTSSSDIRIVHTEDGVQFQMSTLAPLPFGAGRVRIVSISAAGPSLIVWGHYGKLLGIYENDGAGGLMPATVDTTQYGFADVVAADVDGDGESELITSGIVDYEVLGRHPEGGWHTRATGSFTSGTSNRWLAAGDLDGDDVADLVLASLRPIETWGPILESLHGHGDGTFAPPVRLASGVDAQLYWHHVQLADLDGDGDRDIWTWDGRPFVHLNTGPGAFVSSNPVYSRPLGYYYLHSMDFNLDGRPDIAVYADKVMLGYAQSGGGFAWDSVSVSGSYGFEATHVNPDTIPDLVAHTSAGITLLLGDGTGDFASSSHPVPWNTLLKVVDLTGDGWADVLYGTGPELKVMPSDGSGGFGPAQTILTGATLTDLAVGDFNEDGLNDVLYTSREDVNSLLLAEPGGGFSKQGWPAEGFRFAEKLSVADLNADGHLDAVTDATDRLTICIGDGNGFFTCTAHEYASNGFMPWISDVDGDGLPEVLYSTYQERVVRVRGNLGGGQFTNMLGYGDGSAFRGAVGLDYNDDGTLDIVSSRDEGIYVNLGVPPPPSVSVPPPAPIAAHAIVVSPQPVRSKATLRFSLLEPGPVSVDLYDVSGRRLMALSHSWLPAGEHTMPMSLTSGAAHLRAGVYFLRVADSREQRFARIVLSP